MILDMEIGPGERLTERWIEARLGGLPNLGPDCVVPS